MHIRHGTSVLLATIGAAAAVGFAFAAHARPAPAGAPATTSPAFATAAPSQEAYVVVPGAFVPDAAVTARVHDLLGAGSAQGLNPHAFIKLGDSISADCDTYCGLARAAWSGYDAYRDGVRWFCSEPFDSCSHRSAATVPGGGVTFPFLPRACRLPDCRPGETPLDHEQRVAKPAFALIEYGTNDWYWCDLQLACFRRGMLRLVSALEARHVVPVLITVPGSPAVEEHDRWASEVNEEIRRIAAERRLPLIDLSVALRSTTGPRTAYLPDGTHLTTCGRGPSVFTLDCLRAGNNVRDLVIAASLANLARLASGRLP